LSARWPVLGQPNSKNERDRSRSIDATVATTNE
jgi:hypothetical protein